MADFKEIQIGADGQVYQVKDETARNNAGSGDGTVKGVKMNNGSPIEPDGDGVVDLGTVITQHQDISGKVDKVDGKGLSTNDYTTAEKTKLQNLPTTDQLSQQLSSKANDNAVVKSVTINGSTKTPQNGNVSFTLAGGQDGDDGVGFDSVTSAQDGTMVITLSNGDTMTIDLKHNHPQYLKYELLADEAAYTALAAKDSSTLYLIPEE